MVEENDYANGQSDGQTDMMDLQWVSHLHACKNADLQVDGVVSLRFFLDRYYIIPR